ncbi:response regulator transcription factor [Butyrivibrio sp. AE2032]|uniref:response regulator transcription factor n=1 Tax=Butyrivibrio sp. AE2032 TaxID=1458463 RepID=UPI002E8DF0B1|nr:response regulator transcription factor [Butyrivibrio sp. AE2032]
MVCCAILRNMNYNCLIIDDEQDLSRMTQEYFEMFGVTCAVASSSEECLSFLKDNTADIFLLDINLGNESGFALCRTLREKYDTPILFISARQSDDDVLVALNIGGDDYIKKPYTLSVLLAKVKVQLKRLEAVKQLSGPAVQDAGEIFTIDPATMSCTVEGKTVQLKSKEFALLSCLYAHKNTIVTKEVLFDEVWGDSFYSDSTLNVHIRRLREKIEADPNEPRFIKTVWGTGYILETDQ